MTDTLEHATDADLTALLEQDYRSQLRWYPRSWRDTHGDALVGTLMDEAEDTDRFTLEPGEWRSFAIAGTAARLDRVITRPVRDAAAAVLLTGGAGISLVTFVASSWAPWRTGSTDYPAAFGPFADAGVVIEVLWAIALITALAGRWWIGRVALLLSVLVALVMRPLQPLLAPPHSFSLDPGTLTLAAVAALLAVLGTPRNRLPLLAATAGWAALASAAVGYQMLSTSVGYVGSPIGALLNDPVRTSWYIALALGVALVFAIARFWTPAFTILLTVIPPAAALQAYDVFLDLEFQPVSYWRLIYIPIAAGLTLLVLTSRGTFRRSAPASTLPPTAEPPADTRARRRRSAIVVAVLTPLLVLGSTGTAFAASGLDWIHPTAVNWANYWQDRNQHGPRGEQPIATLTFALPGGGTCTTDLTGLEQLPNVANPAVQSARDYLITGAKNGTLLRDARIDQAIADNRTQTNWITNFWGITVRYGYGTANYNPDVEYVEAVEAGLQQAQTRHLDDAGYPNAETAFSWPRCTGMQQ